MNATRKTCPLSIRREVLRNQEYKCGYCDLPFGSVVAKWGNLSLLTVVHWDHVVPYSYARSNPDDNWVAACMICNYAKSSGMFLDVIEIREHIKEYWEENQCWCIWEAPISSELDGDRWAIKFASYLASRARGAPPIEGVPAGGLVPDRPVAVHTGPARPRYARRTGKERSPVERRHYIINDPVIRSDLDSVDWYGITYG